MNRKLASVMPALLLVVAALLILPTARANGPTPVPPNAASQDATAAFSGSRPATNAYSETFHFTQTGTPLNTSCGAGCFAIGAMFRNVSNPTSNLPSGTTLWSGSVTISILTGCPGSCPTWAVTCDGLAFGPATNVPKPCYALKVDFAGVHVSQVPTLVVTRIHEWVIPQGQTWFSTTTGGTLSASVTSWAPSVYGPPTSTRLVTWVVTQVSWAVPLPSGSWTAASTTVQFLNTSTYLTSSQFLQLSSWILIQWTQFPTSVCLTCNPPEEHSPVLSYLFTIVSANGGGGGGHILPPIANNTTIPPSVPLPNPTNKVVVLALSNISYTGGGNYSARVTWKNLLAYSVVGPFFIGSFLFLHSTNVSVTANGVPVQSSSIGITNTSIQLYPGAVTVPNGTSLQLVVSFHYTPTFDPRGVLWTLNGWPITAGYVVGIAVAAVAGILSMAEYNSVRLRRLRVVGAAEGVLLLGALVIVWLGAL